MTEPTYVYVKGSGWVPSYGPVEMTVSERGLQVGDVILGWHHTGNPSMYRPGVEYIVTKISGDNISTVTHPGFYIINGSVQAFLVRR